MSVIGETTGQHLLSLHEAALRPDDRESNERQWDRMQSRIEKVLELRGIVPTPWKFKRSHYKHGHVMLQVVYTLNAGDRRPAPEEDR
jgi:hypothetical protein